MNQEYINAFIAPAKRIWEKELRYPLELKGAENDSHNITTEDMSAYITMNGDVSGKVLYGFSKVTARTIVATMLGQEMSGLDEVARSALGELANMITVHAASELTTAGSSCKFNLPVLIEPAGSRLDQMINPHIRVTFASKIGNLHIHIGLSNHKKDDSMDWLWKRWR